MSAAARFQCQAAMWKLAQFIHTVLADAIGSSTGSRQRVAGSNGSRQRATAGSGRRAPRAAAGAPKIYLLARWTDPVCQTCLTYHHPGYGSASGAAALRSCCGRAGCGRAGRGGG